MFVEEVEKFQFGGFDVGIFFIGGEILQVDAAFAGEPVFAMVAQFDFGGKHGAEGLAYRREVVAADPLA